VKPYFFLAFFLVAFFAGAFFFAFFFAAITHLPKRVGASKDACSAYDRRPLSKIFLASFF
jgi:hypothetical protein